MHIKRRIICVTLLIFIFILFISILVFYDRTVVLHFENILLHEINTDGELVEDSLASSVNIKLVIGKKLFQNDTIFIHEAILKFEDDFLPLPEELRDHQAEVDAILQDGRPFTLELSKSSIERNDLRLTFNFTSSDEMSPLVVNLTVFLLMHDNFPPLYDRSGCIALWIHDDNAHIYRQYSCDLRELTAQIIQFAR